MTNHQLKAKPAEIKCPRCGEWRASKIRPFSRNGKEWVCGKCLYLIRVQDGVCK